MNRAEFEAELTKLEQGFASQLPELEITVRDPALGVEGYVVVWNTRISVGGPLERSGKGGTRITPDLTLNEIKMLAKTMALKNSAAGLPLGGAKSGLRGDPDDPGFEKLYRRFIQLTKPLLRQNGGIFGGYGFDIGARPVHVEWALDELGSGQSFTGKPVDLGGTDYDREGIAGLGVAVAGRTAVKQAGLNIKETTAAVQGLGAMGAAIVKYFSEYGGKITVIADPRIGGTFEIPEGLSEEEVEAIGKIEIDQVKALLAKRALKPKPVDDVLYAGVDVLFPAALQDVIDDKNMGKIKAKFIVEGANNPMDDATRSKFFERSVVVVPDFIANPGGIMAAFVELTSKLTPSENQRSRGNVTEAKKLAEKKIEENVAEMLKMASDLKVAPYKVGRYMALKNLA